MENFKILEEKENPLFNRKEIQASVETEVTPNNSDIEKLICEKFSTPIENIKIKKILGKFGSKTFTIIANIYASKEDKSHIEPEKAGKKVEKQEEIQESPKKIEAQQPEQTKESTESDNKLNQSNESEASEQSKEQ